MHISDFDYELPDTQIAQFPVPDRSAARLLQVMDPANIHGTFTDIRTLLIPGDLLVLNNTRVIKARLYAHKDTGGQAEVLFERLLAEDEALCQVRVSKPLKTGRVLKIGDMELTTIGRQGQFYQLKSPVPFLEVLENFGQMPLPPYIQRPSSQGPSIQQGQESEDEERYQTVFSSQPGAVAAPTAGLHFTHELLDELARIGVKKAEVTLHVGAGTFQPVRGDLDAHEMHREYYDIGEEAAQLINQTRAAGGRVIAVGTTVVRTLESAMLASDGDQLMPGQASTQLFIQPGFQFQVIDALLTNFHLPRSTLLMLVCAFAGYEKVMASYKEAVLKGYRFFSYGDAMYLQKEALEK